MILSWSSRRGIVFFAWFVLLPAQSFLVTARRVDVHRRLGWLGAGLAAIMVVLGTVGALLAARRPTGFMDVPLPPLRILLSETDAWLAFAGWAVGLLGR